MSAVINRVHEGSLAAKHGIKAGDEIIKINGRDITDYLDYMYLSANEDITVELADRNVRIKNEDYEPLGIEFETLLIDEPKSCRNKCIFCFIDQLPPNMRESCYFKDDDYRLSFLQGNYVTLTNISDAEIDRIIEYNLPRINVSVHTTNPELRCKMLTNRFAGKIMEQIRRFADGGMQINCQVVLCRGYNDGAELERTIRDLGSVGECIESLSIVPVGLSAYRDGLTQLEAFDRDSSRAVIDLVEKWQKKFKEERGINFVYLSDEFYIMAESDFPDDTEYDGFPQIENGVGLCASMAWEYNEAFEECDTPSVKTEKSIATGLISENFIRNMVNRLGSGKIHVYGIKNTFFGESITVSGLVTGGDIISQLKGKPLGERLLIPQSMLRHDEEVFLDDTTVAEVESALGVKITAVSNDGFEFFDALTE